MSHPAGAKCNKWPKAFLTNRLSACNIRLYPSKIAFYSRILVRLCCFFPFVGWYLDGLGLCVHLFTGDQSQKFQAIQEKIHTFLPPVIKHEQLGNHPYIQGFSSHLWWLKSICHIYSLYMSMNHPNCREVALSIPFFILSSFCSTKLALMFSAMFFLAAKYVKVDAPRSGGVSREQNQCDSSRSREVLRRCWSS
jgi:hypothetical protein